MTIIASNAPSTAVSGVRPGVSRVAGKRAVLIVGVLVSIALAQAVAATPATPGVDADLLRLMRGMALIKGAFAAIAAVVCYWRLARPMPAWRASAYVGGTWVMAAGAVAIWHMRDLAVASIGLHAALFGLVFLALADPDFFAAPSRFGHRRG